MRGGAIVNSILIELKMIIMIDATGHQRKSDRKIYSKITQIIKSKFSRIFCLLIFSSAQQETLFQ